MNLNKVLLAECQRWLAVPQRKRIEAAALFLRNEFPKEFLSLSELQRLALIWGFVCEVSKTVEGLVKEGQGATPLGAVLCVAFLSMKADAQRADQKPMRDTSGGEDPQPLLQAASEGDAALVEELLEQGANTNVQDTHGMTALMYAGVCGDTSMARSLLLKGADPNLQNEDGATALITAATVGNVAMVRLLLDHHADPNIPVNDGTTPLTWATVYGYPEIVQMLLAHGAGSGQVTTPPAASSVVARATRSDVVRCCSCGEALTGSGNFCSKCGTRQ